MFASVGWVLLAMLIIYIIAKGPLKLNVELSMFVTAVGVAIVGRYFLPFRHIAEGASTYIDLVLIFFAATMFMNIVKESGGLVFMVNGIVRKLGKIRPLVLILLVAVMMIPGALTGAGSVTVLVLGSAVGMALSSLGVSKVRVAATVFLLAGLSAVCPPVSVWAMITCAGTAVPYVGFEKPLLIACLVIGILSIFFLCGKRSAEPEPLEISGIHPKMNFIRLLVPFLVLIFFILMPRLYPYSFPTFGLPLTFSFAALAALLCSPAKINFVKVSQATVKQLLPLMTTMIVIGVLIQVLSATGVRGLISWAIVALPMGICVALLPIIIPISEGLFGFGGAPIFGIPLVWTMNSQNYHVTLVISGLSLLWFLGDALPPTAIIARMTNQTVGYKGSYGKFLQTCIVPWIITTAVAMAYIIWSNYFAGIFGI